MRSALLFFFGFLICISAAPALADKRVALVIGISKYQQVPQLTNPARDADAMSALFKTAGFDVVNSERDLGISDFRRTVREFSETSRDADIAVVYYAGHGIEVDGANYLIPADARLLSDFDVEDETVSLDRMIRALDSVKRLRLIILDACRDNPFAKTIKRSVASRSIGRGLGEIEPAMSDTLIAFAAKAGAVASDGDGQNSPFAMALVKYIAEPGLDLRLAFGRVRDDVLKSTSNRQEPFVYGSLGGETTALVPAVAKPVDPEGCRRPRRPGPRPTIRDARPKRRSPRRPMNFAGGLKSRLRVRRPRSNNDYRSRPKKISKTCGVSFQIRPRRSSTKPGAKWSSPSSRRRPHDSRSRKPGIRRSATLSSRSNKPSAWPRRKRPSSLR